MGFKIWCQVGGGVTPFSKLQYSREFLNIWFQKTTDIRYKRSLWTIFWKFKKPSSICVFVGGFNFRLGTYNVPRGPAPKALRGRRPGKREARVTICTFKMRILKLKKEKSYPYCNMKTFEPTNYLITHFWKL